MSGDKAQLTVDLDRVWAALSRSTAVRDRVQEVADQIAGTARQIARAEAYDTGDYQDSITTATRGATEVRRALLEATSRRARARNGALGRNPLIDAEFKGDPSGGAYDGSVGVVSATNWKAMLVEFGSLSRNPSLVFTRAAQQVADQIGTEFVVIYQPPQRSQNLEAFSRAMRAARPGGEA